MQILHIFDYCFTRYYTHDIIFNAHLTRLCIYQFSTIVFLHFCRVDRLFLIANTFGSKIQQTNWRCACEFLLNKDPQIQIKLQIQNSAITRERLLQFDDDLWSCFYDSIFVKLRSSLS